MTCHDPCMDRLTCLESQATWRVKSNYILYILYIVYSDSYCTFPCKPKETSRSPMSRCLLLGCFTLPLFPAATGRISSAPQRQERITTTQKGSITSVQVREGAGGLVAGGVGTGGPEGTERERRERCSRTVHSNDGYGMLDFLCPSPVERYGRFVHIVFLFCSFPVRALLQAASFVAFWVAHRTSRILDQVLLSD